MKNEDSNDAWLKFMERSKRKVEASIEKALPIAFEAMDIPSLLKANPRWMIFFKVVNSPEIVSQFLSKVPANVNEKFDQWFVREISEAIVKAKRRRKKEEEKEPAWVEKIEAELANQYAPTLQIKKLIAGKCKFSPADFVGKLIGHELAAFHPDSRGIGAALDLAKANEPTRKFMGTLIDNIRDTRLAVAEEARKTADKISFDELKEYAGGFSTAAEKGTFTEIGELVGATRAQNIYFTMWFFWGFVEKLESVRELHDWLRSTVKWADDRGKMKCIEKICERIGLRFRSRGRPCKNPPAAKKSVGISQEKPRVVSRHEKRNSKKRGKSKAGVVASRGRRLAGRFSRHN